MTTADIQQLLASAPPGTTISIVSITVPGVAQSVAEAITSEADQAPRWTATQVVEWVQETYGPDGLKLRDWVSLLPLVSVRELRRAVQEQRVVWHPKPDGRDHGAVMISPHAMLSYLKGRSRHDPRNRNGRDQTE